MGIKGLPQFLKQYHSDLFKPITENSVLRSRIAIDTGVFMHRFTVNMNCPDEYISRFLQFAQMLQSMEADFVFVFDGKPCLAKGQTLRCRREKRAKTLVALQQKIKDLETEEQKTFDRLVAMANSANDAASGALLGKLQHLRRKRLVLTSRTIPINRGFFYRLQEIFSRENIPYLESDGEAEKACAWLAGAGIVDLVVTEDYDALVCGAPNVLRYWHHHDHYSFPSVISLGSLLSRLNLNYSQFVTVCVLAGSDFAQSPPFVGFRRALSFVSKTNISGENGVAGVFEENYRGFYETTESADKAKRAFEVAQDIFSNDRFPFIRNLLGLFFALVVAALLNLLILGVNK
jgi:5'-3' exonuclease